VVHGNSEERELAKQWLTAGNPTLTDLRRQLGISRRIESDPYCVDVFVALVAALGSSGLRIVFMIDEFQRLGALGPKTRETVLSHLRSVFSRCPSRFSVLASVASHMEATALALLTPELRTLLGPRRPVVLPALSRDEAIGFVLGRLKCFRPDSYSGPDAAPFCDSAIEAAIDGIMRKDSDRLTPRWILQILAAAYDEAVSEEAESVTVAHVERVTSDPKDDA
jgi:hypothetical protein